jgi:hypothetical protein
LTDGAVEAEDFDDNDIGPDIRNSEITFSRNPQIILLVRTAWDWEVDHG